jgi:hypothetical protein
MWMWQAPAGINGLLSVAGDTLLIPVGLGDTPQRIAMRLGAHGISDTAANRASAGHGYLRDQFQHPAQLAPV